MNMELGIGQAHEAIYVHLDDVDKTRELVNQYSTETFGTPFGIEMKTKGRYHEDMLILIALSDDFYQTDLDRKVEEVLCIRFLRKNKIRLLRS